MATYDKVCQSPKCKVSGGRHYVASRSDAKTCCPACKSALNRHLKEQARLEALEQAKQPEPQAVGNQELIEFLDQKFNGLYNRLDNLEASGIATSEHTGAIRERVEAGVKVDIGEMGTLESKVAKADPNIKGTWNAQIQMNLGLDGDTSSMKIEVVLYGLQELRYKDGTTKSQIQPNQLAEKHLYLLDELTEQTSTEGTIFETEIEPEETTAGPQEMEFDFVVPAPKFDDLEL